MSRKQILYRADGAGNYAYAPVATSPNVYYFEKNDLPWLRVAQQASVKFEGREGWLFTYAGTFNAVQSISASQGSSNELQQIVGFMKNFGWMGDVKGSGVANGKDYIEFYTKYNSNENEVTELLNCLGRMASIVSSLPDDCTQEIYERYKQTGVYYKNHVVRTSGERDLDNAEFRYQVPVDISYVEEYQTTKTNIARYEAQEDAYLAISSKLKSLVAAAESEHSIHKATVESYESEIFYSKVLRWGLIGLTGATAIVLIILIVMTFLKK